MRIFYFLMLIIVINFSANAQQKSKSLTMDDLEYPTTTTSVIEPTNSGQEKLWRQKLHDKLLEVENLKLKQGFDERNITLRIEAKQQKEQLEQLQSEGKSIGFKTPKFEDIEFRKQYVKLRLEVIEEAKKRPLVEREKRQVYVPDGRKTVKNGKRSRLAVVNTRNVERKPSRLDNLLYKIEDLAEEGRRRGIPPSIFRD
ncbi:MAG: hypothetical protein JNN15_10350 [Blastocatellia bacterium]|nr:hypothetical protein [Blastocatellia bacterium]